MGLHCGPGVKSATDRKSVLSAWPIKSGCTRNWTCVWWKILTFKKSLLCLFSSPLPFHISYEISLIKLLVGRGKSPALYQGANLKTGKKGNTQTCWKRNAWRNSSMSLLIWLIWLAALYLYVFLLLSSLSSLLLWGLYPCLLKCVPAQIEDGLCDCTAVIKMTQEKMTFIVVPTCSSLNPKYGLDQCVFRGVNTPSTQKGVNGYWMMCWSWDVVEHPLLGV